MALESAGNSGKDSASMDTSFRWIFGVALGVVFGAAHALAAATEQTSVPLPSWLAEVPAMKSGDARPFQFRCRVEMPPIRLTVYVSWAPPNHRSIIFCDASDGLPLIVVCDGDGWMYDLVGGQIVHYKSEPKFDLHVTGDHAAMAWGLTKSTEPWGIYLDIESFMSTNTATAKATEEAIGRTLTIITQRGSKGVLQVTTADPPLPTRFVLAVPSTPPGKIECDGIRFDDTTRQWDHPLDVEKLQKEVPYLDAADLKDVPQDKQAQQEITRQLLFGGASFLIRPSLHDPTLREKLGKITEKLDYRELELHERLLKKAWLRALEHQACEPAKAFPPLSP